MDLSSAEVDEYLDFCTHALLGKKQGRHFTFGCACCRELTTLEEESFMQNVFPLHSVRKEGVNHWTRPIPGSGYTHKVQTTLPDDSPEALSRGQGHKIYCTDDRLGALPVDYEAILSKAARWCGVDVDDVALIVERYERRLIRRLQRKMKP
jgi:RNA polymerase I-specific transcription initiation factor RRN7